MLNRRLNHISFRYVHNRLRVKLEELKHPEHPWLTKDAIKLLEDLICPNDIGIEFGSGRSTLWFAERLKHLTSVEDNEVWYSKVTKQIKTSNLSDKLITFTLKSQTNISTKLKNWQKADRFLPC